MWIGGGLIVVCSLGYVAGAVDMLVGDFTLGYGMGSGYGVGLAVGGREGGSGLGTERSVAPRIN